MKISLSLSWVTWFLSGDLITKEGFTIFRAVRISKRQSPTEVTKSINLKDVGEVTISDQHHKPRLTKV